MPRYYCDYCDTYLTHDSPSVRKQHNAGYKHKANVRSYYQQFEEQQTQSLIDQRIKEHLGQHLGQTATFQQVGAAYNQHLMVQRPRLPVLPTPLMPGMRPPLLRPIPGAPGYMSALPMPPMMAPPGAPSLPGQVNGVSRPPMALPPTTVPGSTVAPPPSSGGSGMVPPANYPAPPTSGGFDSYSNAPAPEANH
ncbi:U1 small nuclear ribonucleoprotein C [Euphorbia lathyris]|uniref:U1 small nuclear ribonucleoprotein C n=1 Tax=Euphorbia lathyris TaxID=212925 RepID=UPI0033144A32